MLHDELLSKTYNFLVDANILPVVADNHKEPKHEEYIHYAFIPAGNRLLSGCSGASKHTWVIKANVYVKKSTGVKIPMEYAGEIVELFSVGSQFVIDGTICYVSKEPELSGALESGNGWLVQPVSVTITT